ncbi:protein argonaute 4B-like isoform X2 [Nicotiana sylvestris]|uniref:Protein argonaute 4B-like isoform X1 n=1 Tax=Nicotiana sylvestris TaxID=4096 RepID=A0A1U7VMK1_NICSY|nr:PREDICTED: protein argonaute 4B-like isoform X1 [Nicotiana sylvestris]XP_009763098.1 PREDICTED: protein argonaute 4B-like isoform X1 [Nicotiana sylvestris]XP_009763099.1 PREDICTED: protein argonaute 4B-like isoform X1 [Nicotiana sylvestris]
MASKGTLSNLPPPPQEIPPNVVPIQVEPGKGCGSLSERLRPNFNQMNGPRPGVKGKKIHLLTNHFRVCFQGGTSHLHSYSVNVHYENGDPVTRRNLIRKVIQKLWEIYSLELGEQAFATDGQQSLFTACPLPKKKLEFTVVLDVATSKSKTDGSLSGNGDFSEGDQKRQKIISGFKTFKVQITFVSVIPFQSMLDAPNGVKSGNNEVLRALDTILQHSNAKRNCLLLRQSYFSNEIRNFMDLTGGILGLRGFHSSFQSVQGGLFFNLDVSTTTIIQLGPLVNFLMANQNVDNPFKIDWTKATGILKNLRIKLAHSNREHKITGLSDRLCKELKFLLRLKGSHDQNDNVQTVEVTVYDYFIRRRGIELSYSSNLPCINVGSQHRPQFIPIELCSLVSLQRYKEELSIHQRSLLLKKLRQKPMEIINDLNEELKTNNYDTDPMLRACGISINKSFTQVGGRILSPPLLRVGNKVDLVPKRSRWNFNDKKFAEPKGIEFWVVVNFSTGFDIRSSYTELAKLGAMEGMHIRPPAFVFEENPKHKKKPGSVRVDLMFEQIISKFRKDPPRFILCFLPTKFSCLYGPWKKKCLMDFGIRNQCIAMNRVDEAYLANVILKMNARLGGINFMLSAEVSQTIPLVSKVPTLILGMDVRHAASARSDLPSVAAVVGSRQWPMISCYAASIRVQPPKTETIHSLFKPLSEGEDTGIIRELLMDFYASSGKRKPAQIIIFRQGLCESQFKQIINEVEEIIKACKFLDETWSPKFTLIIAQRRHHTKLFQPDSSENIPPGTVVDTKICHPLYNNNFYMCANAARVGTSRPSHYFVLLDEIGFSSDDAQELVHCLCYVSQRCTSAIYEVAPIRYARLAAAQMLEIVKSEGPQLPKLHKNIRDTMFFC